MNTQKNNAFHIYYLPNAYRRYENYLGEVIEVFGKVGMSHKPSNARKSENKSIGLDVSGHIVLVEGIQTKKEALQLEKDLQKTYDCVEPPMAWKNAISRTEEVNKRRSATMKGMIGTMTGKKHKPETIEKMKNRVPWNKGLKMKKDTNE